MIDLNELVDRAGGLAGLQEGLQGLLPEQLQSIVDTAGIDPQALADMPMDAILQLLADHGVDVQSLDPTQISELVQQITGEQGGGLVETVSGWLGSLLNGKG